MFGVKDIHIITSAYEPRTFNNIIKSKIRIIHYQSLRQRMILLSAQLQQKQAKMCFLVSVTCPPETTTPESLNGLSLKLIYQAFQFCLKIGPKYAGFYLKTNIHLEAKYVSINIIEKYINTNNPRICFDMFCLPIKSKVTSYTKI
jgi:hypothetical protein